MKKKIFRVISLVLAAVMTLSLCSCMSNMEEEVIKRASAVPQTKQEIFDYFCKAIDNAKTEKPAISYKLSEKAKSVVTPILIVLALILSTAYLVDATYNPFLYFRF